MNATEFVTRKMPTSTGSLGTAPTERYEPALPIAQIVESSFNPRTHCDKAKLQELADSLKAKGQLVPVLLRPRPGAKDRYDLAAGHRRLRATRLNGDTTIAAVIREMDDATFLEVLTVENLQREDLMPLEEAAGYAALLQLPGYDVPAIAAKVSKSESYVYRRLALQKLIEPAKKALAKGEIEFGHAEILARVTEPLQKELLVRCREGQYARLSVGQLRRVVADDHMRTLASVPWKLTDATLVPSAGACAICPKRTGASPALFADLATDDRCTDGACHTSKYQAYLARREHELRAEHNDLVILDKDPYGHHRGGPPAPEGAVSVWSVEVVKKGTKGAVPALIARTDQGDLGQVVYVTPPAKRKPDKVASQYQRDAQQRYEKARRKTKAHIQAVQAAVENQSFGALAKVPELAVLTASAVGQMSGNTARFLDAVEWIPKELANRPRGSKTLALVTKLSTAEQARLLLLLTLLPYAPVSAYGDGDGTALTAFCNEMGVKVGDYVRAADTAFRASEQAKAAKKGKGKKATKAKRSPAKKSAKRRAGDLAAERQAKRARTEADDA